MSDELGMAPVEAAVRTPVIHSKTTFEYGRLWPDGTFQRLGGYETFARNDFYNKSYELKSVPESLWPVFGRREIVTTTETYPPEVCEETK